MRGGTCVTNEHLDSTQTLERITYYAVSYNTGLIPCHACSNCTIEVELHLSLVFSGRVVTLVVLLSLEASPAYIQPRTRIGLGSGQFETAV